MRGMDSPPHRWTALRKKGPPPAVLWAVFALWCSSAAWAAGIVPDGSSTTSVSADAAGKASVAIALPVAGVSHNTFSQFNVARAGVDLINTGVNARYIVAEVTSTAPSLIQGPLAVVGPRANFILANPNGIAVNGGSLLNFGRVALTTGKISFNDFNAAPGISQRNIVITTDRGAIDIGPEGLSGALINLEFIAKNLRVGGPVTNTFDSGSARIRAVIGSSRSEIDSAVSPTDNLNDWLSHTSSNATSAGAALVDITPLGSLTAGKIQLSVTDSGAGVRQAGSALASLGDFSLSASGEIRVVGASVVGAGNVVVRGGSFIQESTGDRASRMVASGGAVLVRSDGDIINRGSLIQGAVRDPAAPGSLGAVTLRAGGSVINETPAGEPVAVVFGVADDVVVQAQADIFNRSARLISNRNLRLVAARDVTNEVERRGGIPQGTPQSYRGRTRGALGFSKRSAGFTVDYGELVAGAEQAFLVANGDVEVSGRNLSNRGGEVSANDGDIRFAARERILNEGLATGQVRFERSCGLLRCKINAESNVSVVGGLLNASRSIELVAGQEIENIGGRVLALNDMTLDAPRVTAKSVTAYSVIRRNSGLKALFGDTWAQVYAADQGGSFTASQGRLRLTGSAFNDGGIFAAAEGIDAPNGVVTLRQPRRDPVRLDDHIGMTSWIWK